MQVFKRASAAYKAAGPDQPLLVIAAYGGGRLYIVGDLDKMVGVELVAPEKPGVGNRVIAGHILLGHLDRLGNGNAAAAEKLEEKEWAHAFPFAQRRGLVHKFQNPADAAKWEAAKAADDERDAQKRAYANLSDRAEREAERRALGGES